MDWGNQPSPFKLYPHQEAHRLPTDLTAGGAPALEAIASQPAEAQLIPTCRDLAGLFYFAAGINRRGIVPGGQMYFRAAACTGALYHIELYLVCGDLPDLSAGVYHFGPHDFALRRLRDGDHRRVLVEASGGERSVAQAPAIIVTTSVYWRNSWKYQARAYRNAYWDSGTVLANLLAAAAARRAPVKVVTAFADAPVNRLLDLDDQREVALQLAPLGHNSGSLAPPALEVVPLGLEVAPYSRREVDYPAMREMHAASSLASPGEARDLWGNPPPLSGPELQGQLFPLACLAQGEAPTDTIEEVIQRRGSSRRFRRAAITYPQLSTMLERATRGVDADFLASPPGPLSIQDGEGVGGEAGRISLNQL
jgi:SagB-type dehydrogenase family enzyme